jgi:hypothetical protein
MNVEARQLSTGAEYASKSALKRAIAADPSDVLFISTSPFTPGSHRVSELPFGVRFDIVGPNANTNRKYYGTAVRVTSRIPTTDATVKVS